MSTLESHSLDLDWTPQQVNHHPEWYQELTRMIEKETFANKKEAYKGKLAREKPVTALEQQW